MAVRFVDFHCHLDLYPDPVAAIADADAAGIYTLTVTTTPRAWPRNLTLTKETQHVRAALGLHPQLVAEYSNEISLWDDHLHETRYVGEVGLDAGPRYFRSLDLQKQIFEHILKQCAKAGGKILTVHSVRASRAVLNIVEAHLPPSRGKVVLHWFTGSRSDARRAADLGCYFSVNAAMLGTENGRALVAEIPSDRLLTETDGPFTQVDGRPARPRDVAEVIERLAGLRSISLNAMADTVVSNLRSLIKEP
ncbi:MAG: Qat anti-phage system TatD family nuclease QatD [Bryobacteraceae bacterium]